MNEFYENTKNLIARGEFTAADHACQEHLSSHPKDKDAIYLQAVILDHNKQFEQAIAVLRDILIDHPDYYLAYHYIGKIYLSLQLFPEAILALENCIALEQDFMPAITNLGISYLYTGDYKNANKTLQKALFYDANNPIALYQLAHLEFRLHNYDEAIRHLNHLRSLQSDNQEVVRALFVIAKAAKDDTLGLELFNSTLSTSEPLEAIFGAAEFAIEHCLWKPLPNLLDKSLQYIEQAPQILLDASSFPPMLLSRPGMKAGENKLVHCLSASVNGLQQYNVFTDYAKAASPLKIGFLSPDFCNHSVSGFIRSFINHYDHDKFEVFCYHSSDNIDKRTDEYQATVEHFKQVSTLSDSQLAETIYKDEITLLIDLGSITEHSRIHALMHKPAPIQMTYLGYPFTSGYDCVDYYLADPHLVTNENREDFVEEILTLPQSFLCMSELSYTRQSFTPAFSKNGYITFGSLNNIYKFSPQLIALWAKILKSVPNAKLRLCHPKLKMQETKTAILNMFMFNAITEDRIELIDSNHGEHHLKQYEHIDIALDSFPITGGTTSADCLWMSVPLITLVGEPLYHRVSYSIIKNAGFDSDDLIADSEQDYIDKAVSLAHDHTRLQQLHNSIHDSVRASILCSPKDFCTQFSELIHKLCKRC